MLTEFWFILLSWYKIQWILYSFHFLKTIPCQAMTPGAIPVVECFNVTKPCFDLLEYLSSLYGESKLYWKAGLHSGSAWLSIGFFGNSASLLWRKWRKEHGKLENLRLSPSGQLDEAKWLLLLDQAFYVKL